MNVDLFYKAPKDLLSCRGFVSKVTGEVVELSLVAKVVLIYMIDRTAFFNGNHFETQVTIGKAVGLEFKAAARALKLLVTHGVIEASKERNLSVSPHLCWYYKRVDNTITLVGFDEKVVDEKVVDTKVEDGYSINHDDADDFLSSLKGE